MNTTKEYEKAISKTRREFQEKKALCLFKATYSSEDMFDIASYTMIETAKMFKEELNRSFEKTEDIKSDFDLICALFTITDKAFHGDNEAKQIGMIFAEVIEIDDIPQKVKEYVTTEMMLNSEKETIFKDDEVRADRLAKIGKTA